VLLINLFIYLFIYLPVDGRAAA